MKLFRHLGLMIAIFWCAAMVVVPVAAAAGAGQDTNLGNNQMQHGPGQGPGPRNTTSQQGNDPNNAGPGQGTTPEGFGNLNTSANRTLHAPGTGTMTAPPDKPDRDLVNMTLWNNTARHGNSDGNLTDILPPTKWSTSNTTAMANMTMHRAWSGHQSGEPVPPDWDADNTTATNPAWYGHGEGNRTMPAPSGEGTMPGQDQPQDQQSVQDQMNDTGDLIAQIIAWLKDHGVT